MLCQKDQKPAVDCAVANHPSMVAIPGDVDTISRPVLVNIGNIDTMMPEGEVAKLKEVFLKEIPSVETHVNVFDNAQHGFTVRADLSNETEKKQQVRPPRRVGQSKGI
jgi:dienelactone hydrolase